jgi:copper chaperone CopZ
MSNVATYRVPDMVCDHCRTAVNDALLRVEGVESAEVDLETKLVVVQGSRLDDERLRAAIADAGYEVV